MSKSLPISQEWVALYQTAIQFRHLEPWRWMYDEAIFGVKDPASGQRDGWVDGEPPGRRGWAR